MKSSKAIYYIVATIFIAIAQTSCGWRGEPVPEYVEHPEDTVYNDVSYTAVTGNISNVSAVAVNLHGFANSSQGYNKEFEEQGFLLSRKVSNPTLDDVSDESGRQVRKIKVDEVQTDNSMSVRAYGLIPNTQFYFRTYVVKKNGDVLYGVVKSFMTIAMTVSISDPTRIGLFDCDISATVSGFGTQDYNQGAEVKFRCCDAKISGPTTLAVDTVTPTYDRHTTATTVEGKITQYECTFDNLVPGTKYYIIAYIEIESDFYDYENDNPYDGEKYTYGIEEKGIETDRYKSSVITATATALAGVRSFLGDTYELEYDAIELKDSYFTIPSDTLEVSEYGIAIAKGTEITAENRTLYKASSALRTGNRYDVFINGLELKTTYSYKSYVVVRGLTVFSIDTRTFSTKNYDPKFIDLGLSICWADRNVGAYARNVAGSYFAWGEVATKKTFTDDNFFGGTLEDTQIGGTEKDVATVTWGAEWRMPTCGEVNELYEDCEWKWTNEDGMSGYLITGPNENTIFLPASGIKIKSEVQDLGKMGYFWTSERATTENEYGFAYEMYILNGLTTGGKEPIRKCHPTFGLNVRPVYVGNR